jgi:hypothetical protein
MIGEKNMKSCSTYIFFLDLHKSSQPFCSIDRLAEEIRTAILTNSLNMLFGKEAATVKDSIQIQLSRNI